MTQKAIKAGSIGKQKLTITSSVIWFDLVYSSVVCCVTDDRDLRRDIGCLLLLCFEIVCLFSSYILL